MILLVLPDNQSVLYSSLTFFVEFSSSLLLENGRYCRTSCTNAYFIYFQTISPLNLSFTFWII